MIPLLWSFTPASSNTVTGFLVRIDNESEQPVIISNNCDFHLLIPVSPAHNREIAAGRCKVHLRNQYDGSQPLTLLARSQTFLQIEILNSVRYLDIDRYGTVSMLLLIYQNDGKMIHAEDIPFDKEALEENFIIMQTQ
jgi:hypothetical protein